MISQHKVQTDCQHSFLSVVLSIKWIHLSHSTCLNDFFFSFYLFTVNDSNFFPAEFHQLSVEYLKKRALKNTWHYFDVFIKVYYLPCHNMFGINWINFSQFGSFEPQGKNTLSGKKCQIESWCVFPVNFSDNKDDSFNWKFCDFFFLFSLNADI